MSLPVKDGNAVNQTLRTVQQDGEHLVAHLSNGTAVPGDGYSPNLGAVYAPVVIDRATGALIVQSAPHPGSVTDGSGTIAAGGTSQQVFAAKADRRYLLVQNLTGDDLWINFGVVAVMNRPSIKINPHTAFTMESNFVSNQSVNIVGTTTGDSFTAKQG